MAECDGIYLGIRGGVAEPDIGAKHTTGDRLDIDDNLFMLSGAIGYRYTYFRAEFEYIWRDKSEDPKRCGFRWKAVRTSFRPVRRLSIMTRTCSTSITTFLPTLGSIPYVQAGIGVNQHGIQIYL